MSTAPEDSRTDPSGDYEALTRGTGSFDAEGVPLVVRGPSDGAGLEEDVLALLTRLLLETPHTLSAAIGADPHGLARDLELVGVTDGLFSRRDGDRFEDVSPSAALTVRVDLASSGAALPPVVSVRVDALGHGGARAGSGTAEGSDGSSPAVPSRPEPCPPNSF